MKFSKDYKKLMKTNKKIIMKDAKVAATDPFNWGIGLQVFVDHLYFMRDYYSLNENVWGEEIKGMPSRLQMLNLILAHYEDWMNCEDKYFVFLEKNDEEQLQIYLNKGYYLQEKSTDSPLREFNVLYRYETREETTEQFKKDYEYCRKQFFNTLGDYIEYLWD